LDESGFEKIGIDWIDLTW